MERFDEGQPIWVIWKGKEVRAHFLKAGDPEEAVVVANAAAESGSIRRDVAHFRFAEGDLEGSTGRARYEQIRSRPDGDSFLLAE